MKETLLVVVALLVGGCGKGKEAQTYEKVTEDKNTKPIKVDDNATKPVKELTKEDIVGEYEITKDGNTLRFVFLDNGITDGYNNGKKHEEAAKWKLTKEGELHVTDPDGNILVYRINKDGSLTVIAGILKDGTALSMRLEGAIGREDFPKERQFTFKRIK